MLKQLYNHIKGFKNDERGAFSLFIISIFTTMVLVGGAAVDLMRFEAVRNSLQFNLDRSVLAAASMRQTKDPEVIVHDYMSKVDILSSFSVTMDMDNTNVTLAGRRVSAKATANISTYFLRIAGFNNWEVVVNSSAVEIIPRLEVSLVLDVSHSMLGGQINALKVAANEFVDTVITEADNVRTSVSIIPYATNVSVPVSMWEEYVTEELTDKTRCMIFAAADYDQPDISHEDTQRQLPYYSSRGTFDSGLDFSDCSTEAWTEILPLSMSKTVLHAKIDALQASGEHNADNTAGHIGTKWGVALLDPAALPLGDGTVPTPYNQLDVLKVMVVMTDGINTNHYEVSDGYRVGLSDMYAIFADTGSDNFQEYVYVEEDGLYYEVHGDSLGDGYAAMPGGDPNAEKGTAGYQSQYTWSEVWEKYSTEGYGRLISDDNDYGIENLYTTETEADAQMIAACNAAKINGVRVYTISFKVAPQKSKDLFEQCATSLTSYFDVDETDIGTAFASIAVSIQKLRLTQ